MRVGGCLAAILVCGVVVCACGGGTSVSSPPPAEDASTPQTYPVLADVITIGDVAVFQAVKATIVHDGAAIEVPNAPVIADRPGMFRLYMTPGAAWTSRMLVAELRLTFAGKPLATITDTKAIAGAGTDKDLTSTFNFTVTAEQLPADVEYSIVVRDPTVPADRPEGAVTFPADGNPILLGAESFSGLKVKIVPVQYDADGSGRVSDTTPTQLTMYRDTIYKWYPTSNVEVTARSSPMPWAQAIDADGTGWSELLAAVGDLRAQDAPPNDVYYVATFRPTDTIQSFCGGGCILGLAPLAGANNPGARVAIALGYSGSGRSTIAHELGHAHGRNHAPCGGAGGPDAKFPYAGGRIGVFGFDVMTKKLIDSATYRDFMGYCNPDWVSDYTYKSLYARLRYVNQSAKLVAEPGETEDLQMMYVSEGSVRAGARVKVPTADSAEETVTLSYLGSHDEVLASRRVRFLPYDHLPGGIALVPTSVPAVRVRIDELPRVGSFQLPTGSGR